MTAENAAAAPPGRAGARHRHAGPEGAGEARRRRAHRRRVARRRSGVRTDAGGQFRRGVRVLRAGIAGLCVCSAGTAPRPRAIAGNGHGFDLDHHRMRRRDRRHDGHQARSRGDHGERDARRNRFSRKPDAPRGAAAGPGRCRATACLRRAARTLARRGAPAGRHARRRRAVAAGLGRVHVFHRASESASRTRPYMREHAGDRRRQADGPPGRADRRRRGEGRVLPAPARASLPRTAAWQWRSAMGRTTCRCWKPPTSASPTAPNRSCAPGRPMRSTAAGSTPCSICSR